MWLYAVLALLVPLSVKLTQLNGQIDRCYTHLGHILPIEERHAYAEWLTSLMMERYNLTRDLV